MSWQPRRLTGGRHGEIPDERSARQLRRIHIILLRHLAVHPAAHGYVQGRSVVTCLAPHVGARYLASLDVVTFFHSTKWEMVAQGLAALRVSPAVRDQILSTCLIDGRLPVGASTSPVLSNVACYRMDQHLDCLGTYTRYSDQILVSSETPLHEGLIREAIRIQGYQVNEKKSTLLVRGRTPMAVMGYQIGEREITRPRSYRRAERARKHNEEVKSGKSSGE